MSVDRLHVLAQGVPNATHRFVCWTRQEIEELHSLQRRKKNSVNVLAKYMFIKQTLLSIESWELHKTHIVADAEPNFAAINLKDCQLIARWKAIRLLEGNSSLYIDVKQVHLHAKKIILKKFKMRKKLLSKWKITSTFLYFPIKDPSGPQIVQVL